MPASQSRRLFLCQSAAASSLAVATACANRPSPPSFAGEWEARFREAAVRHRVPGVSLAVIRDAKIVWTRGIGLLDKSAGTPVADTSVFEAASMSKPLFAYAVMKLLEKGVIDLDAPLTRYTPDRFLPGDPRLDRITARHVLSHTTGFQDIRSRANPLRIHFQPGEKWQYSGEGYAYLQAVTTRLAGHAYASPCESFEMDLKVCATDFDAYMKANVLQPLGMHSSSYLSHDGIAKRLARPHDEHGQPLPLRAYSSSAAVARYGAMGGLLTTAPDYARFLIAFMGPSAITGMLTPQVKVEDGPGYSISWALGWKVARTPEFGVIVSHGGDQPGFHSLAEMSPDRKTGYVILTNGDLGWKLIQELAPDFARQVHKAPANPGGTTNP